MKLRKKFFDQVQELKGNIRVFCRVRPLLDKDILSNYQSAVSFPISQDGDKNIISLLILSFIFVVK